MKHFRQSKGSYAFPLASLIIIYASNKRNLEVTCIKLLLTANLQESAKIRLHGCCLGGNLSGNLEKKQ